jgi:hypothetical protein
MMRYTSTEKIDEDRKRIVIIDNKKIPRRDCIEVGNYIKELGL